MIVIFVEFIDQLIDYPISRASLKFTSILSSKELSISAGSNANGEYFVLQSDGDVPWMAPHGYVASRATGCCTCCSDLTQGI